MNVLIETNKVNRRIGKIALWNSVCEEELSNAIMYLQENLLEFELILDNGQYAVVLYSVKSENDEILYYEGGLPNKSLYNLKMQHVWSSIPKSITKFYEELHNGFYNYPSRAMGLVPIEQIAHFKEYEWGILEDLNESLGINIETTYEFFENGMGGYVAVDLNNCAENKATLWFTNDQPEYNVNFWDVTDEWIVIGLQDN